MAVNTAAMFARTRFGGELQKVRLAARVNGGRVRQIQVAHAMGQKTYNRYSRMERGETWPTDAEWKAIVKCLRMDVEDRVRLETMRREGMSIAEAWWTEFDDEFPESLIHFVAYEDAAQKIVTCSGYLVPGLLQTPGYGRTITTELASSTMTPHAVERSVELRTSRRKVFEKTAPPVVEAIIGVAALRQHVGGPDVMKHQLDSLIEDVESQRVVLRVIPYEATAPAHYTFHLFEFGGATEQPIAAFDAMTGMSFSKAPKEVRGIRGLVESLKKLALPPLESLETIRKARKEMSRD